MKYLIFILVFCLLYSSDILAQNLRITDDCNPLVNSLKNITYIVRQEYAIKGPDERLYGKDNKPYFGYRYGPAIIYDNNLIISPLAFNHHQYDGNTAGFGEGYITANTATYYKDISAASFSMIPSKLLQINGKRSVSVPFPDLASAAIDTIISPDAIVRTLVVIFRPNQVELTDTTRYSLSYFYEDLVALPNGSMHLKSNSLGHNVQFGMVFDEVTENGKARLILKGFADMINENLVYMPAKLETVSASPGTKKRKKRNNSK